MKNHFFILTAATLAFSEAQAQTQSEQDAEAQTKEQVLPTVEVTGQAESSGESDKVLIKKSAGTALFGEGDRKETPFTVNIVGSKEVKDKMATTFSDAFETDPSVGNSYEDVIPYDTVSVRGFPISNHIYDGQLVWDAYSTRGVESFEKFEILRGPAAFRFGFVAPGGVLNLVSKQPTENPYTSVVTSITDVGRATAHLDISRRFGSEKKLGLRLNTVFSDGRLFMDNVRKERQMAALATDYRLSQDATIYVSYEVDQTKARGPGQEGYTDVGLDENGALPDPIPHPADGWQPEWGYSKISESTGNIRLNYRFAANWTFDASIRSAVKNIESWGGVTYLQPWTSSGDHLLSWNGYKWDPTTTLSQQAYIQGLVQTGAVQHKLTLGGTHSRFEGKIFFSEANSLPGVPSNINNPTEISNPGPKPWIDNGKEETTQRGIFISDSMTIGSWHPLIGVRQSSFETSNPWSNGVNKNKSTTPLFGLSYDVNPSLTAYASHSTGVEPGGRAPAGASNEFEQMDALKSASTEVGVKTDLMNGEATLDIALFDLKRSAAFVDPVSNRYVQDGDQVHQGIEVLSKGKVTKSLQLSAGFTYMDAKLQGNPATSGNRAENIPKLKAVVSPEYQIAAVPGLFINTLVRYTGEREYNTPNKNKADAFTLWDIGGRYETMVSDQLMITRLYVDNVTDERYWANVLSWGGGRGIPRSGKLSVELQF